MQIGNISQLLEQFENLKYLEEVDKIEYDRIMDKWDHLRTIIAAGDRSSFPRDCFKNIIEHCYYIGFESGVRNTFEILITKVKEDEK
jgi:hypothetical protein